MSPRRPIASPRSTALPTLVALLAAGVSLEGCVDDAHAQQRPVRDAGVRRRHATPVPPPLVPPAGGMPSVQPHPPVAPNPPHPPQRPDPPLAVPGGMGKIGPSR